MPPLSEPTMMVVPLDDSRRIILAREIAAIDVIKSHSRMCSTPPKHIKHDQGMKPKKKKKKVNFSQKVLVRTIPARRHYTREEMDSTWYSKTEFKSIRESVVATVWIMTHGQNPDDFVGLCSRGLEFKSPQTSKERQARKQTAVRSVMDEQECQLMTDGQLNDEYIRTVYAANCMDSTIAAYQRGATDEEEANRIYRADLRRLNRAMP